MGKWKECNIGDLLNLEYGKSLNDYRTGIGKFEVFGTNGKIGLTDVCLYDEPSIIIGRKGAYREVHFAKNPFFVIDTAFYTKKKTDKTDTVFMYYWFKNIDINAMDSGSAIPSTSRDEVYELEIKLPTLLEQIQIASILSSLDDKIDLLHRQNKTLEQLAETLFRQWFVEEPQESWEKMPLSSIADFLNGLACQKFPPKNQIDKLPVLKIKELSSGISENSDWASSDIKSEYIIKNGDVIFAWSASLMVIVWNGEDCILNQHLFKVTSKVYPKWFYYLWCRHHLAEFISISLSHATTMGHIKRGDLDEAMVLTPTQEELKKMTISIQPFFDKMLINHNQIHTLTQLRDTLLPKLMSGEIRVF
jgi:type I restriction enzyme, S subunit